MNYDDRVVTTIHILLRDSITRNTSTIRDIDSSLSFSLVNKGTSPSRNAESSISTPAIVLRVYHCAVRILFILIIRILNDRLP